MSQPPTLDHLAVIDFVRLFISLWLYTDEGYGRGISVSENLKAVAKYFDPWTAPPPVRGTGGIPSLMILPIVQNNGQANSLVSSFARTKSQYSCARNVREPFLSGDELV